MFDVKCGGVIANKISGHIMSPGFPLRYDANLECNYTIQAPDKYINLEFISFDLEGVHSWLMSVFPSLFFLATHSINLSCYH
jgi:hypothetical protein